MSAAKRKRVAAARKKRQARARLATERAIMTLRDSLATRVCGHFAYAVTRAFLEQKTAEPSTDSNPTT